MARGEIMSTPASDLTYNGWLIVRTDAIGKRAVVKCQRCERVAQASVESLVDLSFKACGCSTRPSPHAGSDVKAPSIAHEITKTESFSAARRHRGY
jgi:hypothetical protein